MSAHPGEYQAATEALNSQRLQDVYRWIFHVENFDIHKYDQSIYFKKNVKTLQEI